MKTSNRKLHLAPVLMGMCIVVAPSILANKQMFAFDQAAASEGHGGGNGGSNGNSGGGGNSGGNGNGGSNSAGNNHGSTASGLGALNAAHASESAFDHANPNSRVGKIAAYQLADQVAKTAEVAATQAAANYQVALATLSTAQFNLAAAQAALIANPSSATLQAAVTAANAAVTGAQATVGADKVLADQTAAKAQLAEATAVAAMNAAANKTPVTNPIRAALDALLAGK